MWLLVDKMVVLCFTTRRQQIHASNTGVPLICSPNCEAATPLQNKRYTKNVSSCDFKLLNYAFERFEH